MLSFPNAKINLGLFITARRPDGYHNLETVFLPIPLRDALEVVPATEASMQLSGKAVAGDPHSNLVWKAYKLMQQRFGAKIPPLDIYLHKAIPMGAGLGGGSADGAFMLKLLNDYCNLKLGPEALAPMALELGSDCPFFLYNSPQYATGRGQDLEPLALDMSGYRLMLICPPVHVSTAAAFGMISPRPAPFDLRRLPGLPLADWKQYVTNDFEGPVFSRHPELGRIRDALYAAGAVYAAMSGSGSSIFGLFEAGREMPMLEHLPEGSESFQFEL
jgi:4-diphosphocytidyl-2-C-methyl-D-erythritol kinase